jgi:cytidylate kinase
LTNKIIAIDGPAGSGKSSTSLEIAKRLGWKHLNTGAFYRAATVYCKAQEVPLNDEVSIYCAVMQLAQETSEGHGIEVDVDSNRSGQAQVTVGGIDITKAAYSSATANDVHHISGNLQARELLVKLQQQLVERYANEGIVLEGRDVTDVIAPQAHVKVLLTASEEVRAQRRSLQELDINGDGELDEAEVIDEQHVQDVRQELLNRDREDSKVNDFTTESVNDPSVHIIDNSNLGLDEVVDVIVGLL